MGTLREVVAVSRCAACAALLGWCLCASAKPAKRVVDPWQSAVEARTKFEAQPTHTHEEYVRVMDAFRAIYHGNPADAHAPAAVGQVAELLAEQGRELRDEKSLKDAAGQYAFLAKKYPTSPLAAPALGSEIALYGPDGLKDPADERRVIAELKQRYPRSAAAKTASAPVRASAPLVDKGPVPVVHPAPQDDALEESVARPVAKLAKGTSAAQDSVAMVTGIRHWSTPSYTRVAIDLGDSVQYQAARVEHPDRIFFDLHHARLAPELVGKTFTVTDDGILTKIRAAQSGADVTRVVLDVHDLGEYSAFLLPNPYRLIIDIHGKAVPAANSEQGTANRIPETANVPAPVVRESAPVASVPSAGGEVSSLPPMPVTDGSSGFGLPTRTSSPSKAAVSRPRVVIPEKPTEAKPVPNSVTSRTATAGTDVAAVSDQPGKVEATKRPTSRPIAEKTKPVPPLRSSERGVPTQAPPPTADGETSLVRALGLKIGRIVIDAGHGGHDSGTLGVGGIQEKDVVLDVALRLGKLLHQRLGAEIVYTRADDTFIPLETRTAIANKAQADMFISVHANSSQEPSARGVEVYYLNFTSDPEAMKVAGRENAVSTQSVHDLSDLVKKITLKDKIDESRELATDVDESLFAGLTKGNEGLRNRGVKKAPFVVLIGANMPSILAEISFVTNPSDAAQLRNPEYRERVAESLYAGVARYAGTINGGRTPVQRAKK